MINWCFRFDLLNRLVLIQEVFYVEGTMGACKHKRVGNLDLTVVDS